MAYKHTFFVSLISTTTYQKNVVLGLDGFICWVIVAVVLVWVLGRFGQFNKICL